MKAQPFFSFSIKSLPVTVFITCLGMTSAFSASDRPPYEITKSAATELKDFEGFYQFPNRVAYIQIVLKNQDLVATQVWDNKEYSLVRKADLIFESKNEEYSIEFIKDSDGKMTGSKILNRIMLKKVNFDPRLQVTLTDDKLKRLQGKYQLQKDKSFFLEISTGDSSVELKQLWDGKVIRFFPRSELDFYNEKLTFPLMFIVEGNSTKQLICFTNDIWDKVQ